MPAGNRYVLFGAGKENLQPDHDALEDLSLSKALSNKAGIPAVIGLIFLMSAEDLYIPVFATVTPSAFLLRYDNGHVKIDIDLTESCSQKGSTVTVLDDVIKSGKSEDAYNSYKKAVSLRNGLYEAHYAMGAFKKTTSIEAALLYHSMNRHKDADGHFNLSEELDPSYHSRVEQSKNR
jgi:tetratricopeptide (TPR) repeat protein